MKDIVIAGYARSPFTPAYRGELAATRPDDIAAQVVRALVQRSGIDPGDLEDLIVGCAFPEGEQGFNVARLVGFLADLPLSVGGATVNRFCGSSMQAIHIAAGAMQMGAGEAYLCAGVESMSRVPMAGFNPMPNADLLDRYPAAYMSMGETAENVADLYHVTRQAQDEFALESHAKATRARDQGLLDEEIVPIETASGVVSRDGCIRADTSADALAALDPAFKAGGTVTAGTSSPLTDGAAAVLVTTREYAERNNLEPLARIHSFAIVGCQPENMGIGPVGASSKALARGGISISELDVVELNEAFASQALATIGELKVRMSTLNLDGGAIAIGHPLGATGARITGKAAQLLKRTGGRYALSTQCIGGGQGIATVLQSMS